MKTNRVKKPRNRFVLAMILCKRGRQMKDRRTARGGAKNKQREYLEDV